jgi:hypothetical protein
MQGSSSCSATIGPIQVGNYQTNTIQTSSGTQTQTTLQVGLSFHYSQTLTAGPTVVVLPVATALFKIDWGDGSSTGPRTIKNLVTANAIVESHAYAVPATGSQVFNGTLTIPGHYSFSVENLSATELPTGLEPGMQEQFGTGPNKVVPFTVTVPSLAEADVAVANAASAASGW